MPMPTHVYELVITHLTLEGSGHSTDMTEVNDKASQGYEVREMLALSGGFVFLMSRTVTAKSAKEKSGTAGD